MHVRRPSAKDKATHLRVSALLSKAAARAKSTWPWSAIA